MTDKPKILFVDDETSVLMGLRRVLNLHRSRWNMQFTEKPEDAVRMLNGEAFAVIVSDMRMPRMNGAQLLTRSRENSPKTVRILLTGQADMKDAISVINEGQIFRFLTKPCPPEVLVQSIEQAVEYHYFLTERQELLINTFDSSIKVMAKLIEMFDPQLGRDAVNRKAGIIKLSDLIDIPNIAQVKIAAMLLRIGEIAVPNELRDKVKKQAQLTIAEKELWDKVPEFGYKLLKDVPRLEHIAEIIQYQSKCYSGHGLPTGLTKGKDIPIGSRILKILQDKAELEARKLSIPEVFQDLRTRRGHYDPDIFKQVEGYFLKVYTYLTGKSDNVSEISIERLREGQKLFTPIITTDGMILFSGGTRLTEANLAAIENWHKLKGIRLPINIMNEFAESSS